MPPTTPLVRVVLKDGMHFDATSSSTPTYVIPLDSDEDFGGQGLGVRPKRLLLVSLAGCAAMDVISILRKKQQQVTGLEVQVRADTAREHPRVYTHVWLRFVVTGKAVTQEAVRRSIELSMTQYCPVAMMIRPTTPIETDFEIIEG